MDLKKIIEEADTRVPNSFADSKKVDWLNEVNHLFFDVVKIPSVSKFDTVVGTDSYALSADVRSKNIVKVMVGNEFFRSLLYEDITPAHNNFVFDDGTKEITLDPIPSSVKKGVVVYHKIGTKSFDSANLNEIPEAPEEYHWIYVLGLCERVAKAMNDVTLANNYAADFNSNLLVAQQNFQRE